jgi:serine protease Do
LRGGGGGICALKPERIRIKMTLKQSISTRMINRRAFLQLALAVYAMTFAICRAETDLSELFAKTSPSVVTISTYNAAGRKLVQGSGFVVDKSGIIATCYHVIGNAATVQVEFPDESTMIATSLLRSDENWDVALLKVKSVSAPPLALRDSDMVRVGTAVVAIGSPRGYGNTLSQGIVSGLRPRPEGGEYLQITAPVSPGSSGGVLLSASSGEVVGMTASSSSYGQNLNFAVPARVVSDILKRQGKDPERKLADFKPDVKRSMEKTKKA